MPEIERAKFNSPWTVANIESVLNDVSNAKGSKESLSARINDIESAQGGVKFRIMQKSDYDALTTKDSSTVYYVIDGRKVTQYLGDIELSSGNDFSLSAVIPISNGGVSDDIIAIAEED